MNFRPLLSALLLLAFASVPAQARTIFLRALLDGAQANQGNGTGSPGTGAASVSFDDVTNELSWNISWQDLDGTPNAMHFHGPAPAGQNAGVVQGIGVGSNPAIGSAVITPAEGADLLDGLWYVNLHTSTESGGEIRGQVLRADLEDDFSADLAQWDATSRGLENNAPANYDAPSNAGGVLSLKGRTNNQFWYGSSLESVADLDAAMNTEVRVRRVSLTGGGTAYRSSLWILGDDGHYLHFSQNIGETGWSWNARDDGGNGTLAPTGGGNDIISLDPLDTDGGEFEMGIRVESKGGATVEAHLLHDGAVVASHTFTNFPATFKIVLTGQGRATNDTVVAVFDDLRVFQAPAGNLAPGFLLDPIVKPEARINTAYSASLAAEAVDREGDAFTFAKISGPAWLQVAADGSLSGTPGGADTGTNEFTVEVSNAAGAGQATLSIRVFDPGVNPTDGLFGWWPLNEGEGELAADLSGNGRDAAIVRIDTGGLGDGGSGWRDDPECGSVLSFNGDNATGTYAIMTDGNPGVYGGLPVFTTEAGNDFTWSLWMNAEDNQANNDIILGNRNQPGGGDWGTGREFIKFDSNNFEFDTNNVQGVDYDDIVGDQLGRWVHHVIIKTGGTFTYYRDGTEAGTGTMGGPQTNPQPLFFGGQGDFNGGGSIELWRGSLFDVRLFERAISADEVTGLFNNKGNFGISRTGPALRVEGSGDDLVFTWESKGGKLYTLRSESDPSGVEPIDWAIFDGRMDIAATPPENTLTLLRPADPLRLFVIEEFNAPPVAIVSDDLESGQGSWTTGSEDPPNDTAWELGAPSVVGPLAANSGSNCFGTNIAANYGMVANVWLRSPVVDLSTAGAATLNYAQFRDIETMFDSGTVRVLDAADDSELAVIQAAVEGGSLDWEQVSKKMPAEALGKMVKIEFRFNSDDFQEFAGWCIDDFVVTVP